MKHDWCITGMLVLIFFCAQLIGLSIISQYVDIQQTAETGKTVQKAQDIDQIIARPEVENETYAFIPIIIAVLVGTILVLLLAKFRLHKIWNAWFFLAILIGLSYALHPYIAKALRAVGVSTPTFTIGATLALGILLAYLKVVRKNLLVHNVTEIFVYGGIAALFMNILNIQAAFILLLLISVYDMYAVWKSKHMVRLAEFQAESRLFAGLFIPKGKVDMRKVSLKPAGKSKKVTASHAVLGGGDIAFPLLFTGAVLKYTNDPVAALLIVVFSTIALALLLIFSKKEKFYPAMPFLTAGCFAGFLVALL